MAKKFNPFRPNSLVSPGMFAGRWDELRVIEQCLRQTKHGNPNHFLAEGERGIGKSSLCHVEMMCARGTLKPLDDSVPFKFIVVPIRLSEQDDMFSIVKKLSVALKVQISKHDKLKDYAMRAWELISRLEIKGIGLKQATTSVEESELLSRFEEDLSHVVETYGDEIDGIVLMIDEADKPSESAHLGLLCKLITEGMTDRGTERVCIGLAGLPNLMSRLKASHESSTRLFTALNLKPLEDKERSQVLSSGLKLAVEKNGFEIEITEEARRAICDLSEGYPHFLQEFCYFAFDVDTDNVIDRTDVTKSLFMENGVFDQLGRKYFNNFYLSQINSDAYRHVLKVMARHLDQWVDRTTVIAESQLKDTLVDNAFRTLHARKIIVKREGKLGEYRLPTKSFAVWIKVQEFVEGGNRDMPDLWAS